MRSKLCVLILFFLFIVKPLLAQNSIFSEPKTYKGQFYFYWGYNRGWYTDSDIRFYGADYDFKLFDVVAKDRQSEIAVDPYLHIDELTIPQTNIRGGYYFKDHWSVSLGQDHMKYVVQQYQTVNMTGYIENTTGDYNGVYENDPIVLKQDFLIFEHTDGLNYINVELRRMDNIIRLDKKTILDIDFNLVEGIGSGVLFPRTNTTLLGMERHDEFHVSGYGFSGLVGVNVMFWNHLFLQSELKGGFINMPDIRTTKNTVDRAEQHFFFMQWNILLGINFRLSKPKSETPLPKN